MLPERLFRVASDEIVHDVIDDQVVVVRLDTGVYYSLGGVGALVWAELARGTSVEEIRRALCARYPAAEVDGSLEAFVHHLVAEGLITAAPGTPSGAPPEGPARAPTGIPLPDGFVAPRLEKYTDMQDLLLIDPVHETDERGWPHPDPGAGS